MLIGAAIGLSYLPPRPLAETTAQPAAAITPDKLTVVQPSIQQPNLLQPATEMNWGSPKTLLFDSFDDPAYERECNTGLWSCNN